ncbi:hypothetical protein COLO4_04732 [Corchorus olitorius]|uniref:Uncharacterized protein n=1 Tax=Corchorus olitorius TaxID=93759 RepID=A0A1R3KSX0_9ROSI|nr:hypothetical protein COLO4_04732 [Corchorus olitorius]
MAGTAYWKGTLHDESKYMRRFRQLSKQEGDKCDGESLVNVNGHTMQKPVIPKAGNLDKDCILVTILVAVKGCHKLPTIKTANGVKRALRLLILFFFFFFVFLLGFGDALDSSR